MQLQKRKKIKVTVCEMSNNRNVFLNEWEALVAHVRSVNSDLVLLPEMPFYPWIVRTNKVDASVWQASVEAHNEWMNRLSELSPATILSTCPVIKSEKRLNEGFVWEPNSGYRAVHAKYYLPNEEGFWEATWYDRGPFDFAAVQTRYAKVGFLICTEMWFTEHARAYAKQGIHILACPRATPRASVDKWIAGGRVAAVMSGAFCLSSNYNGDTSNAFEWGGNGWIIEPEEGNILGLTSPNEPFLTLEIDLRAADLAKKTYPRYVFL